jgi:hypothetical protein
MEQIRKALLSQGTRKKILYTSLAVLVCFIILVAAGLLILSDEWNKGKDLVKKIREMSIPEAEDLCGKENGLNQDMCYVALSDKTNNTKYCLRIPIDTIQGSCIKSVAEKTKNSSLCSEIKDLDKSYYCIALAENDINKCDQIENNGYRRVCRADFEN